MYVCLCQLYFSIPWKSTRSTTTWRSWAIPCWRDQQSWMSWFPKLNQKSKASQIPKKRKGLKGPCLRTYAYTCTPGHVSIWPLTYLLSGIPGRSRAWNQRSTYYRVRLSRSSRPRWKFRSWKAQRIPKQREFQSLALIRYPWKLQSLKHIYIFSV